MADLSLLGRCGLYCGACGIYRAYRDDGKYLERVAESFECAPELVRCEGCQDLTEDCWGHDCRIRKCLSKKKMSYCHECDEIEGCDKFTDLYQGYLEIGVDLRENLRRIESGEIQTWLEEQDQKWRCGTCGKPVSCHMEECHRCGAILVGINE